MSQVVGLAQHCFLYSLALSHNGATMALMKVVHNKESRSSSLERLNLRLLPEVLEAIDAECSRRAGNVSRNTWITEAIQEKLARNGVNTAGRSTSTGDGK